MAVRPDSPVMAVQVGVVAVAQARRSEKLVADVSCTAWPITVSVLAVVSVAST